MVAETNIPKGKGRSHAWLTANARHDGEDCLIWPFSTSNGYGTFGYLGKMHYAHRYMCELVHGPAPSPEHEAGHSCGHGHLACVNPKHLSWRSKSENQLDRAAQGTKNTWAWRGKITEADAIQIRALRGKKYQREIAEMFGISRANVSLIQNGNTWRPDKHRRGIDPEYWPRKKRSDHSVND